MAVLHKMQEIVKYLQFCNIFQHHVWYHKIRKAKLHKSTWYFQHNCKLHTNAVFSIIQPNCFIKTVSSV